MITDKTALSKTFIHEIKNPLMAIQLQCEDIKSCLSSTSEIERCVSIIEDEVNHINQLTSLFSKFVSDPVGEPEKIELVSFISDIVRLFPQEIKTNFDRCPSTFVLFDKNRARSVFENLIKNACESSASRVPVVTVELVTSVGSCSVLISDNGDGIPESARDKLFTPFFSTKKGGSGIGLSLVKHFTEAAGGSLSLSDRDGGGTVAEVILPLAF